MNWFELVLLHFNKNQAYICIQTIMKQKEMMVLRFTFKWQYPEEMSISVLLSLKFQIIKFVVHKMHLWALISSFLWSPDWIDVKNSEY